VLGLICSKGARLYEVDSFFGADLEIFAFYIAFKSYSPYLSFVVDEVPLLLHVVGHEHFGH
jgi:hypothetical protein